MAAISQKYRGLIGGVSQQPDSLKLDGQLRECDNFYPDPTFGLIKRPGTKAIRQLDNAAGEGSFFFISKGDDDKLIFKINRDGTTALWDAQSGVQQTINAVDATAVAYATHVNRDDIEVLQINDYVFVLNRSVFTADGVDVSAAQTPYGYVTLTTVAYDTSYTVTIDGTAFTYSTPTSSGASLNANTIITNLVNAINANANFTAIGVANFIHVSRVDNADFTLEASGSISGTGLKAYKSPIGDVADLPDQFLNNETIEIGASAEVSEDNYYLTFETSDGSNRGAGVWVESVGPEVNLGVDPNTMPHALIKEADGTYSFRALSAAAAASFVSSGTVNGVPTDVSVTTNGNARWSVGQKFAAYGGTGINLRLEVTAVNADRQITDVAIIRAGQDYTAADVVENLEGDTFTIDAVGSATISGSTWADQSWGQRTVGDAESAPDPSFIGERITGLSFFKNRLVLMSQENVVCSQVGSFLSFYPETVITIIDSDPIDLSAGALRRVEFRYAIQQPSGLLVFADNAQYILQTRTEAFSPSTAELNGLSTFSHSSKIKPLDLGTTFVIVEQNSKSISANELTFNFEAPPFRRDLTKVIPSYIPANITQVTNTVSASIFGLVSGQEPDAIYCFRYYTQDQDRLVASWFKWTFPANIRLAKFDEELGYFVLETDDGFFLSQMNLLTETPGGAIAFEGDFIDLRLDFFDYNPEASYVAADDETRVFFKEGANIADGQPCLVFISEDDSGFVQFPDLEEDAGAPAGQQFYVAIEGDQTDQVLALGYRISSTARLPSFYYRVEKVADEVNIPTIQRVRISSFESGPFEISLFVPGRADFTLTLPQLTTNLSEFNTAPMLRTAENIIPVMAKGTEADLHITCNSPFPLNLVNLTWEGTYNTKGIRPR